MFSRFGGGMMGGYGYGGGYGGGFCGGFGGGIGWMGMALHALVWIAVIVAGVYLFRRWSHHGCCTKKNNALDVLNDRFARGEISSEEYQQRKRDLLS